MPKTRNFTYGWVQNRDTKNRSLGMIVRSFQDFKLRGKQISTTFCYLTNKEASTVLCSVVKHAACDRARKKCRERGKWNFTVLVHHNTGKKNRYRIYIFATLISALWRFYRANKFVIYTLRKCIKTPRHYFVFCFDCSLPIANNDFLMFFFSIRLWNDVWNFFCDLIIKNYFCS